MTRSTTPGNSYMQAGEQLILRSGCEIRRWRKSNTGTAYTRAHDWGIEVPFPRGPISFGVFAHEVAHQMLHRGVRKPRWVEEVEAEEWALDQFDRYDLPGRDRYDAHVAKHLTMTFARAVKRGVSLDLIADTYPSWWQKIESRILDPELSQERADLDATVPA